MARLPKSSSCYDDRESVRYDCRIQESDLVSTSVVKRDRLTSIQLNAN